MGFIRKRCQPESRARALVPSVIFSTVAVSLLTLASAKAAWRMWGSGRIQGTVHVLLIVQSSIQLTARISGQPQVIAGGTGAAVASLHLSAQSVTPGAASSLVFTAEARVANSPQSSGYKLQAIWSGCPNGELFIDGKAIPIGSEVEITKNKISGDAFGQAYNRSITMIEPSAANSTCSATLALIAQPTK